MSDIRHIEISTLPQADNNNGWLGILPALPAAKVASGDLAFDHLVIGGGYSGLAAARRLAELNPDSAIALIDAGRIANNAAGRCSGFAIDQAHNIRTSDFAAEIDAARDQIALNRAGQGYLREIVTAQGIECDWREDGKIHAAASARGCRLLEAYRGNLDLLEADYRRLDAAQMQAITGTGFYQSGLFTPGTILVQPAALVRGLAESLPKSVAVFENSAVTAIEYGQTHQVLTASAQISAHTVVLANNGFGKLFGFYDKHIIPISSYGSLTRKMTEAEIDALGGEVSWGVVPADPFGTSVRRTADDRILIRNIYQYSPDLNHDEGSRRWARSVHERSFKRRFPMLSDLTFEYTWGGAMALSRNGAPVFGKLADRVFGSFCHNGVGIARGTICGKLIAEFISGKDSWELRVMQAAARPNRLPAKPLMNIGVRGNFAMRRLRAGVEL